MICEIKRISRFNRTNSLYKYEKRIEDRSFRNNLIKTATRGVL